MSESPENGAQTLSPPRRRWWRDVMLGIVLFSCGCFVGGIGVTRFYTHRLASIQQNGIDKQRAFLHLKRALKLDEKQAPEVQAILGKGMSELRGIRRSVRPQISETLQRMRADVAAKLNDHQKEIWFSRFDKLVERWFPAAAADQDGPQAAQ